MTKKEQNLTEMRGTITHIVRLPGEEKKKGAEKIM